METSQFEEAKDSNLNIEKYILTFDHIVNYATDILVFADLEKAGFNRKDKQILTEALSYKPYFYYQFFTFRDCKKDKYVCYSSSIRI